MIQVNLFSNAKEKNADLAIKLLSRLQNVYLISDTKIVSLKTITKKKLLLDLSEVLDEFGKKNFETQNDYSIFLLTFGAVEKRILIKGRFSLFCLEGLKLLTSEFEEYLPIFIAFSIFKNICMLHFKKDCSDNTCMLSSDEISFSVSHICEKCQKKIKNEIQSHIAELALWFNVVLTKIFSKGLSKEELKNIYLFPKELLLKLNLEEKESICYVESRNIKEDVRVAIVQLKINFDDELCREFNDGGLYNKWTEAGRKNQIEKINKALDFLKNEHIDLIAFPELSIPDNFPYSTLLEPFSNGKKPLLVLGSHYSRNKENTENHECSILLFPCGGEIATFSQYPSIYEAHSNPLYTYIPRERTVVLKGQFKNIGIVICKDLFHVEKIYKPEIFDHISLIICVMCDKRVDIHYDVAKKLARQKYVLLVNSVGSNSCGDSAFFGPVDRKHLTGNWQNDKHNRIFGLPQESKEKEAIIIGSFNIRYPYIEKQDRVLTTIERQNYNNFYNPKIIYLD